MTSSTVLIPSQLQTESRTNEAFPELTPAQLARIEPHGRRRRLAQGEVVGEPGQPVTKIFVVVSGQLDAVTPLQASTVNMPTFTRGAFILRRLQLIDRGYGDVVVLGSEHCSGTLHIREFLTRNGHPYTQRDLDTDPESQELLDHFHLSAQDVPVVICRGTTVLKNPTIQQLADCLGLNPTLDRTQIWDVVIIGAGPAGLGAAVYAASEGLNAVIIEANAPGGQAGTSSRIENYLGFPLGISGQELASRAYDQAQKFGARVLIAKRAMRLGCDRKPFRVLLDGGDGDALLARGVIIAAGVEYRKLAMDNLHGFENAGVYYAATQMERRMCADEEVAVVGGANSAGQAAVVLAETAKLVHMVIRADGLSSTMSRYLISRIDAHPRIEQHARTEIVGLEGNGHLERVSWRTGPGGPVETQNIRHVFTMTGAEPSTGWLAGCLALDGNGFVKTGAALTVDELVAAKWPLRRQPYLLETSIPGVLAVGDARSGSTKRVASAVGEGSIATATVHQVLAE